MKQKSSKFIAMWDMYGLEALINVTEIEQNNVVEVLKGNTPKHSNPLHMMILRAKFNTQRHYEIYAFLSEIDEVSIVEQFKESPQFMAELIREKGEKIYSDRISKMDVLIT